jgi:hypothetical protein
MERMRELTGYEHELSTRKFQHRFTAAFATSLITIPLYGLFYEQKIRKIPFLYQGLIIYSLYRTILYLNIKGKLIQEAENNT